MLDPQRTIEWGAALAWLAGIAVVAFLVSWLFTDRFGGRRTPYIGLLALVAGGLTAGYQVWSGNGTDFWLNNWPWGIAGALIAGGFLALMISRMPVDHPADEGMTGTAAVWEGGVYGAAEGLLLSVLPVIAAWQMFHALEWTEGWRAWIAVPAAIVASVVVIVTHHLGYPEYRGRAMIFAIAGCGVLSVAYLATANPIAAVGGHIILHLAIIRRGAELPPHEHAERRPLTAVGPGIG